MVPFRYLFLQFLWNDNLLVPGEQSVFLVSLSVDRSGILLRGFLDLLLKGFVLFLSLREFAIGQRIGIWEIMRFVISGKSFCGEFFFQDFHAAERIGHDVVWSFDVREFWPKLF